MKLIPGTAEAVYDNQVNNPLYKKPVFQILRFETIGLNSPTARIRANLSDGVYYTKAYFSTSYNQHFEKGMLKTLSLIKISNFLIKVKNDNPFIYVQKLEEFEDCEVKIGNPICISLRSTVTTNSLHDSFDEDSLQKSKQFSEPKQNEIKQTEVKQNLTRQSEIKPKEEIKQPMKFNEEIKKAKVEENKSFTKLAALNPFMNDWSIKGRVVSKSEIRTFSTQKGEGKLFSFEFQDSTNQIKIIAFNDPVDVFFPLIEVGGCYKISKGSVKMANKQFSSNTCDYEIHLEKNSEIEKLEEEEKFIPSFNFVKIKDLNAKGMFDVIGVIKEIYNPTSVIVKSTKKETLKRDLILVDETGSVRLTLWGNKAELDLENEQVLVLKGVRASEYNGVSLSSMQSTQIFVNLETERVFEIKGWFEENKENLKINLTKRNDKRNCIQEVKDNELEYSYIIGSIMFIKEDNLFYDSCLSENCNKKVNLEDNGRYRCDKCNLSFDNCNQRYIVSANLCDFTGQIWASIFNESAISLFGYSANELKELKEENSPQIQSAVRGSYFSEYGFKIKSRHEFYNNEPKTKYTVLSLDKVNYLEESKKLIDDLEKRLIL